ncbi:MAG: hypothetical protein ACR2I8_06890, partial [Steroidobacteraceae bacterium]
MRNSIADATRALLAAVPLALTLAAASSTAFGQADLKPPKPTVLPSPAAAEPGTEPVTPAAGTPQLTPA